jgi:hypothetical protein
MLLYISLESRKSLHSRREICCQVLIWNHCKINNKQCGVGRPGICLTAGIETVTAAILTLTEKGDKIETIIIAGIPSSRV